MKLLPIACAFLSTPALTQQGPAYVQPMSPNGGQLRPSQLWIDPTGQNDSDCDALAWEDFTLSQTTTITSVRWWGEAAPTQGFTVEFFNQDPGTTAVQPDLSGPILSELHPTVSSTPVTATLYRFDTQLYTPLTFQPHTRYFVSIVGRQPNFCVYWNWAQSPTGPNGTFWWQRGLHMYFHLSDNRAVGLSSSAGWPAGEPFCFGDGSTTPCPCSNPSTSAGRGCDNSAATGGATLAGAGTPSLSADSLMLFTSGQRPTGTSIVLQGAASNPGIAFGQGLRCISGSLKRLYTKSASLGSITAPEPSDASISARSAFLGDTILPSQHRYYMVYYRDPTVLGGCPALSTFNTTSALDVLWTL